MRFLLASSLAFSVGGLMMKPAQGFTRIGATLGVLGCFVVGAAFLTLAVQRGTLGTTYVLGLGLEAIVTFVFATAFLGEHVTPRQLAGVALAITGLVLLG